ncbi:CPBP family glutamic-type intramembrane protease [Haladaptatus sp. NG-SE-30]
MQQSFLNAIEGAFVLSDPQFAGSMFWFTTEDCCLLPNFVAVTQPQFQERLSVLPASLAVGVLWWAWHLPLFLGHPNFTPDPLFFVYYTTFVLGVSTVLGALVNVTDGTVIPAVLLHAAINLGSILEGSGGILESPLPVSLVVGSGAWWLIAVVLVGLYGRSMVPGPTLDSLS